METSFKEYCRRKLDEAAQFDLLDSLIELVQKNANKIPFFAGIAADRQKFSDSLYHPQDTYLQVVE